MKKGILGLFLVLAFSSQAEAKFYKKDILTFNAGTIEAKYDLDPIGVDGQLDFKENIYGFSILNANGAGKWGYSGGMDYLSLSGDGIIDGDSVEAEYYMFSPNFGVSYGITNNLYIVPNVGITVASGELTTKVFISKEGDFKTYEKTKESETNYGANIGSDLIYMSDSGFVLGFGGRLVRINEVTHTQLQVKIGFSFK